MWWVGVRAVLLFVPQNQNRPPSSLFSFFLRKKSEEEEAPPQKKKQALAFSLFVGKKKRVPSPLPSFLPSILPSFLPLSSREFMLGRSSLLFPSLGSVGVLSFCSSSSSSSRAKISTMATAAANEDDGEKRTNASCYCGKIQMEIRGRPVAVSICHCTVCRRLSGGAFSIQSLHSKNNFSCAAEEVDLWSIQSSPNVTRYRCKECGSPVYATLGKGKTYVVPRSALTNVAKDDECFAPTHHMHYKQRVIDVEDELPKYVGTSTPGRAEVWNQSLD